MQTNAQPLQAFWLDPFRPLRAEDHSALAAAGFSVRRFVTLEDISLAFAESTDDTAMRLVLIVGLSKDAQLLEDLMALLPAHAAHVPLICRVERRDMEATVAAMQLGARHVVPADDWTAATWQAAFKQIDQISQDSTNPSCDKAKTPPSFTSPAHTKASFVDAAPAKPAVRSVIYVDPASRNLLALAQRVAQANVTVLVEGPTGSGKEVLARVLHEASPMASGPFIGLNCAALPEHMMEDMLFGHEKGAFTGAVKEHRGLFEQAHGGTLFLDEIGELPFHLQSKLLRVLQERTFSRLGSERVIALNVRIVAATNKNLRQAIVQREFREDLYFRLSTFKLHIPTLAQRPGDILPLVSHLLSRHLQGAGVFHTDWRVSPAAQAALLAYPWPGNVRELENVIQRAMVICGDGLIDTAHLIFDDAGQWVENLVTPTLQVSVIPVAAAIAAPIFTPPATFNNSTTDSARDLYSVVQQSEHSVIQSVLQSTRSREEAARKLGISPRTLRYKLAKLKTHHAEGALHD